MSDEALAGGLDAPAAPVMLEEAPARAPAPIQGTIPAREPEKPVAKPEPAKTAKEAVQRAQEAVKAKEAAKDAQTNVPKPEAKVEGKTEPKPTDPKQEARQEQTRDNGKFAPRQEQQPAQEQSQTPVHHREPPARFSQDAKAEWEAVPDKVKAEIHRATRELEQGINKYRGDAERYETVRQYDDMARKNGGDLSKSLTRVVEIEDAFLRDPIEGFRKVAQHFGLSLEQVASHVLNQPYDQRSAGRDGEVVGLKNEIAQLKETINSLQPVVQEYKQSSDERALSEWAADKPYFKQLRGEVAALVQQGYGPDEAYRQAVYDFQEKAASFGFVPQPAASSAPAQQPRPLNPAGQKSISGAPAAGSDPVSRKAPATSVKEAVKRAFAAHA